MYWGNVKDEWWSFPWIFYFDFIRWSINHSKSMLHYFTYYIYQRKDSEIVYEQVLFIWNKITTITYYWYFVKLQRVCTFAYEFIVGNETKIISLMLRVICSIYHVNWKSPIIFYSGNFHETATEVIPFKVNAKSNSTFIFTLQQNFPISV